MGIRIWGIDRAVQYFSSFPPEEIPMIAAFRKQFPNIKISVIVWNNGSDTVLQDLSIIDELYIMCKDEARYKIFFSWIRVLRSMDISHCIVAWPGGIFSALLALFSGASVRIGHMLGYYPWISRIFFSKVIYWKDNIRHDLERNLELAMEFGIEVPRTISLEKEISLVDIQLADVFLKEHLKDNSKVLFGIVPGSGRGQQFKRWPIDYFISLSNQLISDFNGKIIVFIGPDEEDMVDKVVKKMKDFPIVVRRKTICEVAAIMSKCKVIVTNDSGLMHVATTTAVPVIAIMGPTDSKRTSPYGMKNRVVSLGLPCSPCYNHFQLKFKCLNNTPFKCLGDLKPNIVLSAISDVLGRKEKLFCLRK